MVQIGKNKNFTETELQELFVLGYNHDIGYEIVEDVLKHNIVGGEMLKNSGYKFWREVYYHGEINIDYSSLYLDILNQADMQIDKFGNDVGYDKRLEDIKSRYGENAINYIKCKKIVEEIRNK